MIKLNNLERRYSLGKEKFFYVLRDINLGIGEGEFVSIMGPSGRWQIDAIAHSGDARSRVGGEYFFNETAVHHLKAERSARRSGTSRSVSCSSNIICSTISPYTRTSRSAVISSFIAKVSAPRWWRTRSTAFRSLQKDLYPRQLSGGQQQLVGVARRSSLSRSFCSLMSRRETCTPVRGRNHGAVSQAQW